MALEQQHLTAASGLSQCVAPTNRMPSRKVFIPSSSCREVSELTPSSESVSQCWDTGEGITADGPRFLTQRGVFLLTLCGFWSHTKPWLKKRSCRSVTCRGPSSYRCLSWLLQGLARRGNSPAPTCAAARQEQPCQWPSDWAGVLGFFILFFILWLGISFSPLHRRATLETFYRSVPILLGYVLRKP